MAKNHSYRKVTKKSVIAALCALSIACTGLAAACAPAEEEDDDKKKPTREDTQLLKNGDFEYFDIPDDAIYLIKNVNNWTLGGGSSVKSGIIGTNPKDWDALSDYDLTQKLDYNNDVGSSSDDYINYNSMRSRDILYREPHAATRTAEQLKDDTIIKNYGGLQAFLGIEGDKESGYTYRGETVYEDEGDFYFDKEFTKQVRKDVIDNPHTHLGEIKEEDGEYTLNGKKLYSDDDGNLFTDEEKKNGVGNVLMVHNYTTDGKYNGIQQYYSSTSITLEANTAAEISVWVKTSDLKFDKGYSALNEQDKGASIEVVQTVNGTTLDNFVIKNINTEKIIAGATAGDADITAYESNGWLNYKIYVNACDFASSTIQLRLGLGQSGDEQVTGYAFFDDVSVKKYRSLEDEGTDCTYNDHKAEIEENKTSCTLISKDDEKVFNADKELRTTGGNNNRHAYHFAYSVDLASTLGNVNSYTPVEFGSSTVTAGLTTEKDGVKLYAAAKNNGANIVGVTNGDTDKSFDLVKNFKGLPTENDLLGAFANGATFGSNLFSGTDYSKTLNDALTGENAIPALAGANTYLTLSAWGAPYTSTIKDGQFKLAKDNYAIVSFWVKTSDVSGTAATVKIYDAEDTDKEHAQSIAINTTGVKTNFEDEKDIYNGWVNCFLFVANETDDETEKTFNIDFSFGATTIKSATYNYGWAAIANMQVLGVDKEVYELGSSGSYTALFSFSDEDEDKDGNAMDSAVATSDVKKGIANPANYLGINGGNSSISGGDNDQSYDASNTNKNAGLINRDGFKNYDDATKKLILDAFCGSSAAANWDEAFGADCYQPLIIINNLRTYSERKVSNYGFVGSDKTIATDGYETISVRVKVSGDAVAYIYLVDAENPKNLLKHTTPAYTFYYDNDGNVLDEKFDEDWKESEHREHIVYTLRDDGLYDGKDGKVYANLYNLKKSFKNFQFEHEVFYDENGNAVLFDNLEDGKDYYDSADKATRKLLNHYLTNTAGTRVYEYKDGKYYYIVDKKTSDTEVEKFDVKYARYDYKAIDEECLVKVENTNGKWKTVNFVIHTGSNAKKYKLELWSGARNETGVTDGNYAEGAVAFDYSSYSVTSSNYTNVIGDYENTVIDGYKALLKENGLESEISSNSENIAYYEELVDRLIKEGKLTETAELTAFRQLYTAKYYTFTLYDSANYVPFNSTTAKDGETGYNYKASDFSEVLAYFEYEDTNQNSHNVFLDYSSVDQNITLNTSDGDTDDGDTDEESTVNGDLLLYISSILLVVVLLLTIAFILGRKFWKKHRVGKGDKQRNKNVYRQRDRYIKKLKLVKNEDAEETVDESAETPADASEPDEVPAEEVPTEQAPAEETESDGNAETPDENGGEEKPE